MKFSDKFIESLKPAEKINDVREANGFGIRVLPSGVKTWFFIYRIDGKRRFMNLGHYPSISLAEARKKYRAAFDMYEQGKDPARASEEAKEERRNAPSVSDLVTEYMEKHAKIHKRSWVEDERILNKEVVPLWGERKAADIKKRDVVLLLEGIMERGSPGMSNNTFQVVRKMFNFAVERDILPFSPATGIKALAPKVARERALSEAEVKTFWERIEKVSFCSDEVRRALKLVLVTGQRPGEVSGMHSAEIDGNWWTIPASRAKNAREHRVFLTQTALDLIGPLSVIDKETGEEVPKGFVFPSPHTEKNQAIQPRSLNSSVQRNLEWPVLDEKGRPVVKKDGTAVTENRLNVAHFTVHDLRRTAATFMASMGFMDEVIDAVLNHVKQGIIRTYNRHKYDMEKQAALESWERRLTDIVSEEPAKGGKVFPIIRKKASE